jgi:F-type H+-transporting ATPase subunit beta
MVKEQTNKKIGKVVQIIGAVVDVEFEGYLPAIYDALETMVDDRRLVLKLQVIWEDTEFVQLLSFYRWISERYKCNCYRKLLQFLLGMLPWKNFNVIGDPVDGGKHSEKQNDINSSIN